MKGRMDTELGSDSSLIQMSLQPMLAALQWSVSES